MRVTHHTPPSFTRTRAPSGCLLGPALALVPLLSAADPERLAHEKNCFSCHKVDGQRIGPPYVDVARKYRDDVHAKDKLIRQIERGSRESSEPPAPQQPLVATVSHFPTASDWHSVTMPPQPQVNPAEAESLAEWILSLVR